MRIGLFLTKLNVLCQFDGSGVVDSDGGSSHVVFPGVGATLATAASSLLSAERTAHLRTVRWDIHVHDTAVRPVGTDPLEIKERNLNMTRLNELA